MHSSVRLTGSFFHSVTRRAPMIQLRLAAAWSLDIIWPTRVRETSLSAFEAPEEPKPL